MQSRRPSTVVVYRNDRVAARYPLARERKVTIEGARGSVDLAIDGHCARITRSSCRKQLCVQSKAIRTTGQQIICVPNHIVVEIEGREEAGDVDAVSR